MKFNDARNAFGNSLPPDLAEMFEAPKRRVRAPKDSVETVEKIASGAARPRPRGEGRRVGWGGELMPPGLAKKNKDRNAAAQVVPKAEKKPLTPEQQAALDEARKAARKSFDAARDSLRQLRDDETTRRGDSARLAAKATVQARRADLIKARAAARPADPRAAAAEARKAPAARRAAEQVKFQEHWKATRFLPPVKKDDAAAVAAKVAEAARARRDKKK